MKDPAMLFYPADFLVGCSLMNMKQRGEYITLLCQQFESGHLSEEDIMFLCGELDEKVLSHFEKDDSGKYFNARLEKEKERRKTFVESRQKNLSKKEVPHTESHTDSRMDSHTEYRMGTENINVNINTSYKGVKGGKKKGFSPPTVEEIREYCRERKNNVDPECFFDFYSSKGWKIGANAMKDWRAAVRTWEKREPARHGNFDANEAFENAIKRSMQS